MLLLLLTELSLLLISYSKASLTCFTEVKIVGLLSGKGNGNSLQYSGKFQGQRGLVGYSSWVAKSWT